MIKMLERASARGRKVEMNERTRGNTCETPSTFLNTSSELMNEKTVRKRTHNICLFWMAVDILQRRKNITEQ
jgi:hypothetical protein